MQNLIFSLGYKGVYGLDCDGATGKSFISTLVPLVNLYARTEYVRFITYSADDTEQNILHKIDSFEGPYLILDRLDLYITESVVQHILNKDCTVLIDLKNTLWCNKIPMRQACIVRSKNAVEVVDLC